MKPSNYLLEYSSPVGSNFARLLIHTEDPTRFCVQIAREDGRTTSSFHRNRKPAFNAFFRLTYALRGQVRAMAAN